LPNVLFSVQDVQLSSEETESLSENRKEGFIPVSPGRFTRSASNLDRRQTIAVSVLPPNSPRRKKALTKLSDSLKSPLVVSARKSSRNSMPASAVGGRDAGEDEHNWNKAEFQKVIDDIAQTLVEESSTVQEAETSTEKDKLVIEDDRILSVDDSDVEADTAMDEEKDSAEFENLAVENEVDDSEVVEESEDVMVEDSLDEQNADIVVEVDFVPMIDEEEANNTGVEADDEETAIFAESESIMHEEINNGDITVEVEEDTKETEKVEYLDVHKIAIEMEAANMKVEETSSEKQATEDAEDADEHHGGDDTVSLTVL
jgi:hypothetical protein